MVDNELTKMLRDCLATSSQALHLEWGHPEPWDKCPFASCHGDYALTRPGAGIGEPAKEDHYDFGLTGDCNDESL